MGKAYYCKQCGKELKRRYKHELCQKHWEEKCRYGECISDTQMCEDDPSEIRVVDGIGRISLYNVLFEEIDEEILIDVEDIEKVKNILTENNIEYKGIYKIVRLENGTKEVENIG